MLEPKAYNLTPSSKSLEQPYNNPQTPPDQYPQPSVEAPITPASSVLLEAAAACFFGAGSDGPHSVGAVGPRFRGLGLGVRGLGFSAQGLGALGPRAL